MSLTMKCTSSAVLGLLVLATSSCRLQSPQEDVRLGREVADAMEGQVGRFDDAVLASYVDGVARRVEAQVQDKQFQFQFAILDQPEPNAFAAPGGAR